MKLPVLSSLFILGSLVIVGARLGVLAEESATKETAAAEKTPAPTKVSPALDFKVKDIDGKEVHLGTFQGKVLLIVNVASK